MVTPASATKSALRGDVRRQARPTRRVQNVKDVVKEGDKVKVKLLGFDDRGKVRLSMKIVDQATGKEIPRAEGEPEEEVSETRPPRRERGDRGGRGGGGEHRERRRERG